MEQLLKGVRGVTRACSKCGKPIASRIRILGLGSFSVFCSNAECKSYETVTVGMKFLVTVGSVLVFVLFIFGVTDKLTAKKNLTCDSFKTYEESLSTFNLDPEKYSYLDRNHNGEPCEDLKE